MRARASKIKDQPLKLDKAQRAEAFRLWRELKNRRIKLYWSKGLDSDKELDREIAQQEALCNIYNNTKE